MFGRLISDKKNLVKKNFRPKILSRKFFVQKIFIQKLFVPKCFRTKKIFCQSKISSDIDPQILADPSEVIFDPSMIPQMPKTT